MALHFPWTPCPQCGSTKVFDTAADDAPMFRLECEDCGHEWETAGFGMTLAPLLENEDAP